MLIALLKASFVFLADLSRAIPIPHQIDFVELAGYGRASAGGHERVRLLKDLNAPVQDRDVLIVEDLPVRYVGFTVPDELFVGYGFDLEERFRNLPDLRLAKV